MSGQFTGWAWPAAGNYGFYLGSEGLLMGNYNNGKYVYITSDGSFGAPGLYIANGSATFSGSLSAATGTFSGTLTASAINAVNTLNIAGNAVTIPVSAYSASEQPFSYDTVMLTASIYSSGAPIAVFASITSRDIFGTISIVRDGILLTTAGMPAYSSGGSSPIVIGAGTIMISDTPGAGWHTYQLKMQTNGSGYFWSYMAPQRSMILLETKR